MHALIKILLDTDIGGDIDDAICLAYLLKEPNCKLMGITTVCGEATKRAMVADAICKSVNAEIPIYPGHDLPLQPIPVYPTPEGAKALVNWDHKTNFKEGFAVDFMYQTIIENPHEIVILGIGNMTNIATLFNFYPKCRDLLKGLYVMNGYFGEESLPEAWYNWNSWADPMASKIVFQSIVPTHRAITLDVTQHLTIDATKASTILHQNSNLMKCVFDFGKAWLKSSNQLTFHDPLVAVSIFHEDICNYAKGTVNVETENQATMGATLFARSDAGNVEISTEVDVAKFFKILNSTLNS